MQKRSDKDHRPQITDDNLKWAMDALKAHLDKKLDQKGKGAWLSRHEILGIITEEVDVELKEAVHSETNQQIMGELADIAVGCVFAMACIEQGTLDW